MEQQAPEETHEEERKEEQQQVEETAEAKEEEKKEEGPDTDGPAPASPRLELGYTCGDCTALCCLVLLELGYVVLCC